MREHGRARKVASHVDDVGGVAGGAVDHDEAEALNGGIDAVAAELHGADEGIALDFVLPYRVAGGAIEAEDAGLGRQIEAILMRDEGACAADIALPDRLTVGDGERVDAPR